MKDRPAQRQTMNVKPGPKQRAKREHGEEITTRCTHVDAMTKGKLTELQC